MKINATKKFKAQPKQTKPTKMKLKQKETKQKRTKTINYQKSYKTAIKERYQTQRK